MALIKIDWNPSDKKLRQFGVGLLAFAGIMGGFMLWKGKPAGSYVLGGGVLLGLVTLGWPMAGCYIYKAWMSISFVIGTVLSFALLGLMYYGVITPLALVFRLIRRDVLHVRKPAADTYWIPTGYPEERDYYERLF